MPIFSPRPLPRAGAAQSDLVSALDSTLTDLRHALAYQMPIGGVMMRGPRPWADVRAYGAKGDGVTNDRAAVQAAIDTAPATGGTILFPPPGPYFISGALSTKRGLRFVGSGAGGLGETDGATIIDIDTTLAFTSVKAVCLENLFFRWAGAVGAGPMLHWNGVWNSSLVNVHFRPKPGGNNPSTAILVETGPSPFTFGAYYNLLQNVSVISCSSDGIRFSRLGGTGHPTVTTLTNVNSQYNGGSGLCIDFGSYLVINGCSFEANTGDGIKLGNTLNIVINGGLIEGNTGWGVNTTAASGGIVIIETAIKHNTAGEVNDLTGAAGLMRISSAEIVSDPVWKEYTPAWTAVTTNPTIGNGTLRGRWKRIGRTVHVEINLIAGSTTTFGVGEWRFSLPITAAAANKHVGSALARDVGVAFYTGVPATMVSESTVIVCVNAGGGWSPTVPFTWGATDEGFISITYETP